MKEVTWGLILTAIITLAGCAAEPDKYEVKGYTSIANPASVYCVQQGGKLETVSENEQRITYCVLSSEKRVEEWEYYRQNHHSPAS
ncbi:DUF333 domain-containing protein [Vibrio sp. Isolate23]|uniref:putative hemolysin n=1 Tax=Vibrio TaxID=662 RepID=UPI001EFC3972|nr:MULTISPECIES: DUF333 domain-containing protein [Vibrio]MCG9682219.1 DUF333 domain-containing protein [Vibrio sp. Isolate23]USD35244.1 DUF333 domain-containing protein [Vibrio sp. SCSIO 43186]USD48311.1 DUF333 domain-containing protein [Vibrio sp. SCSIO 43145]USD72369.1 DUF333 domain-containing protein [Vibrio sp. SCSIO 43139]USD98046.1 hypothetical protein CTT30_18515 [Vibrio coralliilyticus]